MSQTMQPEAGYTVIREHNPSSVLEAHFHQLWAARGQDFPAINPKLAIKAIGFARVHGDWMGVMVTPWFVHLILLAGGGTLWGDIPLGQRRYLDLPGATLPFTAAEAFGIGAYQYSPLLAQVSEAEDMAAAQRVADDALQAILHLPGAMAAPDDEVPSFSRRGFFRRLAGKRA